MPASRCPQNTQGKRCFRREAKVGANWRRIQRKNSLMTTSIPKIVAPDSPDSKKSKALITIHASQLRSQLKKGKTLRSYKKPLFSEALRSGLMKNLPTSARKRKAARKLVSLAIKKRPPVRKNVRKTPSNGKKKNLPKTAGSTGHANSPKTVIIRKKQVRTPKSITKTRNSSIGKRSSIQDSIEVSAFKTPNITRETFVSPLNTPDVYSVQKASIMEQFLKDSDKTENTQLSSSFLSENDVSKLCLTPSPAKSKRTSEGNSIKRSSSRLSMKVDCANVDEIKSLFLKQNPSTSYGDLKGLKQLFRSRHMSPKADYTNIAGLKRLFANAQLTPQADYDDVFGLKGLFRSPKVSPKADYTNVKGVKRLLQSPRPFPKANYRNVKGLKRVLRSPRSTPLADYSNVSGMKKLFKTPEYLAEVNYDGMQDLFASPAIVTLSGFAAKRTRSSSPKASNALSPVPSPKMVKSVEASPKKGRTTRGHPRKARVSPGKTTSLTKKGKRKVPPVTSPDVQGQRSKSISPKKSPQVVREITPATTNILTKKGRRKFSPGLSPVAKVSGKKSTSPQKSPKGEFSSISAIALRSTRGQANVKVVSPLNSIPVQATNHVTPKRSNRRIKHEENDGSSKQSPLSSTKKPNMLVEDKLEPKYEVAITTRHVLRGNKQPKLEVTTESSSTLTTERGQKGKRLLPQEVEIEYSCSNSPTLPSPPKRGRKGKKEVSSLNSPAISSTPKRGRRGKQASQEEVNMNSGSASPAKSPPKRGRRTRGKTVLQNENRSPSPKKSPSPMRATKRTRRVQAQPDLDYQPTKEARVMKKSNALKKKSPLKKKGSKFTKKGVRSNPPLSPVPELPESRDESITKATSPKLNPGKRTRGRPRKAVAVSSSPQQKRKTRSSKK